LCAASVATGTEAVTERLNPAHDGYQPNERIAPPLFARWRADLPNSVYVSRSIVVAAGRVFVTSSGTATQAAAVYALDRSTGTLLWGPVVLSNVLGSAVSLTYEGGQVFALDYYDSLAALDEVTGAIHWGTRLPGQFYFPGPPVALGGLVYVIGLESGGTLYAVDEQTGSLRWTAFERGDNGPTLGNGHVLVSGACGDALSFDALTGQQLWHEPGSCTGGVSRVPSLHDGLLYSPTSTLYAQPVGDVFDETTGALAGSFSYSDYPVLHGNRGYFVSPGWLNAYDLSTGKPVWGYPAGSGVPVVANGYVFAATSTGKIVMLDEASGVLKWSTQLPSPAGGLITLVVADDMLFVSVPGQRYWWAFSGCP
jgi:outer membrane protein assembly factor BamB